MSLRLAWLPLALCSVACSATNKQAPERSFGSRASGGNTSPARTDAPAIVSGAENSIPPPMALATEPQAHLNSSAPLIQLKTQQANLMQVATPVCETPNWDKQVLRPLLHPTNREKRDGSFSVVMSEGRPMFDILGNISPCDDSPSSHSLPAQPLSRDLDNGVRVTLSHVEAAGESGRHWTGNRCEYDISLSDGTGRTVRLDRTHIPPFNSIYAVLRAGGAVYVGIQFNGYAKEFPQGGCAVIALDLCEGSVRWHSSNYVSNGDLALVDNAYLVTGYGFTAEKRILQVTDAHSGKVLQTLRIPGNPESMQFQGGLLTVQTNHGPARFTLSH